MWWAAGFRRCLSSSGRRSAPAMRFRSLLPRVALLLSLATTLLGHQGHGPGAHAAQGNGRSVRAQEVLESLRGRLPEVAQRHGMDVATLEALIRRDRDLWIDEEDRLLFVCEGLDLPEESVGADGSILSGTAVLNSNDAFKLHSLPGAPRVVYLDFNGHVTSGTSWNSSRTGGADIVSAPFDMDGNPNSWSTGELDRIKRIWQRVAEDFAPFAVNVTTEDPGVEALRRTSTSDNHFGIRVVISPSSAWYGSAGGVAYLQSFQWNSDTPCFVFSDRLGPNNEKYVAEAISHEVGHTLGLSHDGQTNGTGYYQGHGDWAPIMGVGYYRPITQWSRGEYTLANNLEDDLARMQQFGAPLAVDDHGNTPATATALVGPSILTYGVIEHRNDIDLFSFTTGAGTVSFTLAGPSPAPNLDIKVDLLNAAGAVISTSNPAGLAASLTATVAAGTYYLRIDGVGTGDPVSTGYSDYGSIGEYRLTGTIPATGSQAPVAAASATPVSGTAPLVVNFSSANSHDSDGSIVAYAWNFGNGATSTAANPTYTYTVPGNFTAVLTVTDNSGLSSTAAVSITVAAPPNQLPIAKASASTLSGVAPLAVTFSSSGSSDPDGSITGYAWAFGDGTSSTAANPTKTYSVAGTYTVTLTVTDDRGGTGSTSLTISVSADNSFDVDVHHYTLTVDKTAAGSMAVANVRVLDRLGRPVAGATVTMQWSGLVTGAVSATTNSSGVAVLSSKRVKNKSGTITGVITQVGAPTGYRLVSALYPEPMSRSVSVTR
jgi:PKD repeat protein